MEKYIKESDLKKYLDKQHKEAVRLKGISGDDKEYAYYCHGKIDLMNEIAIELDLGILG